MRVISVLCKLHNVCTWKRLLVIARISRLSSIVSRDLRILANRGLNTKLRRRRERLKRNTVGLVSKTTLLRTLLCRPWLENGSGYVIIFFSGLNPKSVPARQLQHGISLFTKFLYSPFHIPLPPPPPPPTKMLFLGTTVITRRNSKQRLCKVLWGQTRCTMGDVQMANGKSLGYDTILYLTW